VGPSSIAEPARQHAAASARRLLKERTVAFAAVGLIGFLGTVVLTLTPLGMGSALVVEGWVAVSAATAGWLAFTLLPRGRSRAESGFAVNVVDEPRLHEWMVDLSRRAGVSAPGAIRIAPATGAWIDQLEGEPTLVIGAGSIGWLTRDELERTVGLELAMLRVREDETVVAALRIAESVRADRLARCGVPLVGFAVRILGRRLAARADDLREACVAWALEEAHADLTPTEDDVKEATLVDEAWDLLDDRWLAPARRLGLALDSIALAHRELLVACEENGLIERTHERDHGPAALSLLSDPQGADIELAGWAAAQLTSGGDGIVGWEDYAERVAMPTWRQTAADAVAAAAKASGRAQPATIDALVKAVDSGLGLAMGTAMVESRATALHPHADPPPPTDAEVEKAIADSIAHSVCLAMVESEVATPTLDVLWGVGLADENGQKLDVDTNIRGFLAAGDISALRWYLQSLGLDTSRPLPLDGVSAVSPLPEGAALVAWQGRRSIDLVVSGATLLGFRHSLAAQLRGVASRLTGSYDELVELDPDVAAALDLEDPAERPRAQLTVDLDSVTGAELYRTPRGSSWTLRLNVPGHTIRITGVGDARLVTQLLEPHLGGRLRSEEQHV